MCGCGKPVINGNSGYSWDGKTFGIYPVSAPSIEDGDMLLWDEPGRCGGLDSHAYHFRVIERIIGGQLYLLVRHGGGDERMRLCNVSIKHILSNLTSTDRYWLLQGFYHQWKSASRDGRDSERSIWQHAAADGRIKTRKLRGKNIVKVWIERKIVRECSSTEERSNKDVSISDD